VSKLETDENLIRKPNRKWTLYKNDYLHLSETKR